MNITVTDMMSTPVFTFSDQTKQYLTQAGWHPGRRINIGAFKKNLLQDGYVFFPIVEKFLKEFGGIKINFLLGNDEGKSILRLDPKEATKNMSRYWPQVDYCSRLANTRLCLIGDLHLGLLTLMMDEKGVVYGGFEDFLCSIAKSGEEAIEAICSNHHLTEIK